MEQPPILHMVASVEPSPLTLDLSASGGHRCPSPRTGPAEPGSTLFGLTGWPGGTEGSRLRRGVASR